MNTILIIMLLSAAVFFTYCIARGIYLGEDEKKTALEKERERGEAWEESCRKYQESKEAAQALRTAYDGIRRQNAAGLGLYIPSLLHRAFEGEDITKEEAATAMRLTYFDIMKHAPRAEDFAESTREDIMRRYDYAWLLTIAESLV